MGKPIETLTIEGYKSIRSLKDFPLNQLNILIGANGAGKSNFISFFKLLNELVAERLQLTVAKEGGADAFLYLGPKNTTKILGKLYFGLNGYEFVLEPTVRNQLVFTEESIYKNISKNLTQKDFLSSGLQESSLKSKSKPSTKASYIYQSLSSVMVYHFHDTSETAEVKRRCSLRDYEKLRPNAANLAAFLYKLQENNSLAYQAIRDAVRLIAPFFDDFKLRPIAEGSDQIELEWVQVDSDYPFHVSQLSDGTLRFISLATALLQPEPPATILIDEPELGLHPYALTLVASLIKKAAERTQVIVSTQAATLLDHFAPEDVIVVERQGSESVFSRPNAIELIEWLEEYSLGELWQKNLLGGRPRR